MTINPNNNVNSPESSDFTSLLEFLKQIGKPMTVRKGESILSEGDKVDCVFFIESGCFRTYRWVADNEVTIGFSFAGDIDTCPFSFINDTLSLDSIVALSDSRIIRIYRSDINILTAKNPQFHTYIHILLSHYIEVLIQRNIDLRTKNAEVLYRNLLDRQPREVSSIPLMYIASYLGISKERLSRIRKKL
jgi:CRP-like cAMP-binding protein